MTALVSHAVLLVLIGMYADDVPLLFLLWLLHLTFVSMLPLDQLVLFTMQHLVGVGMVLFWRAKDAFVLLGFV